jgi:hypothetical protein
MPPEMTTGLPFDLTEVRGDEGEELVWAEGFGRGDLVEGAGLEGLGGSGLALGVKLGVEIGDLALQCQVGLLGVLP